MHESESDYYFKPIPTKKYKVFMVKIECSNCDYWSGKIGDDWLKAHCNKKGKLTYRDDMCEFFAPVREGSGYAPYG